MVSLASPAKFSLFALAAALLHAPIVAQQAVPASLIADVVQKQLAAMDPGTSAYRYTLHKSDKKGTVVRLEIITPYGHAARTILREGKPLTSEAEAFERERLQEIISSSSEQKRRLKAEMSSRKDAAEIVSAMQKAMIYTMRPGQPQLPGFPQPQIVMDFKPNPAFNPESIAQKSLRGIAGTLWIDAKSHIVRRIEAHGVNDINIMLGIAAKVYTGATLETEQREYSPGRVAYTKLNIEARVRELMVRTVDFRTNQEISDLQRLPDGLTLQAAAQMLLEAPSRISIETVQ